MTSDPLELVQALEQLRAEKIVEAVSLLFPCDDLPTPFQAGYQLACEETLHRLQTEIWDGCLIPKLAPKRNFMTTDPLMTADPLELMEVELKEPDYSLKDLRINAYKKFPRQADSVENSIFSLMRQAHRLGVRTERARKP